MQLVSDENQIVYYFIVMVLPKGDENACNLFAYVV